MIQTLSPKKNTHGAWQFYIYTSTKTPHTLFLHTFYLDSNYFFPFWFLYTRYIYNKITLYRYWRLYKYIFVTHILYFSFTFGHTHISQITHNIKNTYDQSHWFFWCSQSFCTAACVQVFFYIYFKSPVCSLLQHVSEFTIPVNQNKIESKLNNVEMSKENKPYFSFAARQWQTCEKKVEGARLNVQQQQSLYKSVMNTSRRLLLLCFVIVYL